MSTRASLLKDLRVGDELRIGEISITLVHKSGQVARLALATAGNEVSVIKALDNQNRLGN